MKRMIPIVLLLLTGCDTLRDVSYSDSFYRNKIDVSFCTKKDLDVRVFKDKYLDHPKLQKYRLNLGTVEIDGRIRVPEGTKVTILKVYRDHMFGVSKRYIVLSRIDTPELKDKLVNSSWLFGRYGKQQLSSEHAEYCS